MKYAAIALALLLSSCSPSPDRKIDIHLENLTAEELKVEAKALGFSRTVTLLPGEKWSGWLPAFVTPKDIKVTIKPKSR